jgi:hypothetical protein
MIERDCGCFHPNTQSEGREFGDWSRIDDNATNSLHSIELWIEGELGKYRTTFVDLIHQEMIYSSSTQMSAQRTKNLQTAKHD